MKKLVLLLAALASCGPPAYYVANVYVDDSGGLLTQRCALDGGRSGGKPDPSNCRYERVGPPPPEVAAQIGAPPPPPAPAGMPPAPPAAPPAPQ